jgi:hypothetical protein
MFVGKLFKKHQKKILLLLIILAALFLLNRQFRIFEGLVNRKPLKPHLPKPPLLKPPLLKPPLLKPPLLKPPLLKPKPKPNPLTAAQKHVFFKPMKN